MTEISKGPNRIIRADVLEGLLNTNKRTINFSFLGFQVFIMPSSLSLPLCVLMLSLKPSIAPSPCPTVPPSSASHGFKVLLHPYAIPFLMHAPSPFPTADLCMPGVNMSHRRREQSDIILSTFVHSSLTLSRKVRTFLEALTQLSPLWDMCSVILGWRFFKSRPNQSAKMNTKCQTSQNSLTST